MIEVNKYFFFNNYTFLFWFLNKFKNYNNYFVNQKIFIKNTNYNIFKFQKTNFLNLNKNSNNLYYFVNFFINYKIYNLYYKKITSKNTILNFENSKFKKKILFYYNTNFKKIFFLNHILFYIFYYNLKLMIFGNKFFKNEILSLNWNLWKFSYNLWKFSYVFFFFNVNSFNLNLFNFFFKMRNYNYSIVIIGDIISQFNYLYYFNKFSYISIGLIPITHNPWSLTYGLHIYTWNLINQFLFFYWIIFLKKKILILKYYLYFQIFNNFKC